MERRLENPKSVDKGKIRSLLNGTTDFLGQLADKVRFSIAAGANIERVFFFF